MKEWGNGSRKGRSFIRTNKGMEIRDWGWQRKKEERSSTKEKAGSGNWDVTLMRWNNRGVGQKREKKKENQQNHRKKELKRPKKVTMQKTGNTGSLRKSNSLREGKEDPA